MIHRFKNYPDPLSLTVKKIGNLLLLLFVSTGSIFAQNARSLSLGEAIDLGLKNSKALKISQTKIDEAISQYKQAEDAALPKGSASYVYNHAEIPTTSFKLTPENDPFHLPNRADAFLGTLSLQEVVFGGNRLRYAKESTDLLTQVARLDADKNKEDITFNIINAYFNLYKLQQSRKVVQQNLEAIDQQIHQAQRFFEEGIVTKNDVLRFQLQRSNIELTGVDLETNRKIVVYNLNVLLGLPENTDLAATEIKTAGQNGELNQYIDSALTYRQELKGLALRSKVAETNIKSLKAETLPTVLLGADAYYINPSGKFIPPANTFIAPIALGATVAWNFDRLWMNKNKVAEARIKKSEVDLSRELTVDNVKTEVNQNYQNYLKAVQRIGILETSIAQAQENDRILESKYRNNVATATDRLDAQTQLFQSLINLELAKADAGVAYYTLLKSTGTITR